ncbi:hypothetical protein NLI96_g7550 [Meripilus lineatus]|uniref:Uncharacterized protein n=1 Tax=Meripilus lineatus TaxID=2056292 RepID=A0AAD5V0M5_9APHY|nr:hypothetical protein NLI96_g7550 [Physisporinus lineatus]
MPRQSQRNARRMGAYCHITPHRSTIPLPAASDQYNPPPPPPFPIPHSHSHSPPVRSRSFSLGPPRIHPPPPLCITPLRRLPPLAIATTSSLPLLHLPLSFAPHQRDPRRDRFACHHSPTNRERDETVGSAIRTWSNKVSLMTHIQDDNTPIPSPLNQSQAVVNQRRLGPRRADSPTFAQDSQHFLRSPSSASRLPRLVVPGQHRTPEVVSRRHLANVLAEPRSPS